MISVGLRFAAAILLGIVASSCTTTSTEAPTPSRTPESLARAGRMLTEDHPKVGIVLVEMTADPRRDQPSTGTDVYSDVSSAVTRSAYEAATEIEYGILIAPFLLASAPVAGAMSAPLGVSAKRSAEAQQALSRAYAAAKPAADLGGALVSKLRESGSSPQLIRRETFPETTWNERDPAYFNKLARRGFRTVFVVEFWGHSLAGGDRFNPRLAVSTRVDGRVVDAHSGKTIGSATVKAASRTKKTLTRWAGDGGASYTAEMQQLNQQVAADLIAKFAP